MMIEKQYFISFKFLKGIMNKSIPVFVCIIFLFFSTLTIENASSQSTTQDDCPGIEGNSTKDRFGCIDSDGDGWSDEDENWTINNGADAFKNDKTQWKDTDKDGYGDNSTIGANNIDYWPEDRLRHNPVLLIACEPASNTIIISEKSSFFCKVTNPMNDISVNIRIEWIPLEGISSEWVSREVTLQANGEQGHLTMFSVHNTGETLGLSGGEIKIWVQNQQSPSAIAKLPIYVIKQHPIVENDLTQDVSKAFSFSRMHEGVEQVTDKIEQSSGILLPTWSIYVFLVVMFSLSLKKPARIFTAKLNKDPIKKDVVEKEPEYGEPPQYIVKKEPQQNNLNENVNEKTDVFDYVPKRLR